MRTVLYKSGRHRAKLSSWAGESSQTLFGSRARLKNTRTCNANAETAHALYHWRHQLNQFVLDVLRAEGHTNPEKIVERENWSVKKREKYANKVVDELDEDGRMRELYKEFKENIEAARDAKVFSNIRE